MLMATMTPKSLSSGIDDRPRTATPAMAVMPETMKARPVRRAVASMAWRGERPRARSSTNRNRMQGREFGTDGHDERARPPP